MRVHMRAITTGITFVGLSVLAAATPTGGPSQLDIDWYTIDGGGGTSTGGSFSVSATIGQPDTGVMSGGAFTLTGGFWHGGPIVYCPADIAGPDGAGAPDGNVDSLDFLLLLSAWGSPCAGGCEGDLTGPGGSPDGNVDALDFLLLIGEWGSPAVCPVP